MASNPFETIFKKVAAKYQRLPSDDTGYSQEYDYQTLMFGIWIKENFGKDLLSPDYSQYWTEKNFRKYYSESIYGKGFWSRSRSKSRIFFNAIRKRVKAATNMIIKMSFNPTISIIIGGLILAVIFYCIRSFILR